ncbi:MAG TPA: hypothetical protein VFQ45_04730 [Longimicrobium sp.]|nr:hypothetical protein [Longimicrobium sp.]
MSQGIRVQVLDAARRDLERIAGKDWRGYLLVQKALRLVEDRGWAAAASTELLKVLDQKRHVGEIRVLGRGGYRLFFFWHDDSSGRTLWIAAMPKKKDVEDTNRFNAQVSAVAERRRRFLEDDDASEG